MAADLSVSFTGLRFSNPFLLSSALLVIRALLAFVSKNTFAGFAWYRILFGIALVVLYWGSRGGF